MKPTQEQLLALALDEIDSPAEEEALRAAISGSRELQAEYAEVEGMARELAEVFQQEELSAGLDPHRQSEIRVLASTIGEPRRSFLPILVSLGAAAAVVALLSVNVPELMPPQKPTAQNPKAEVKVGLVAEQEVIPEDNAEYEEIDAKVAGLSLSSSMSMLSSTEELMPAGTTYARAEKVTLGAPQTAELSPSYDGLTGGRRAGSGGKMGASLFGAVRESNELPNSENYNSVTEPDFVSPRQAPLSTFSIDVDTASYTNVRRYLTSGTLPPADAVRVEEMLNYFRYNYTAPKEDEPVVALHTEIATCPWEPSHRLARVAVHSRSLASEKRPPANLVFLVDVSGSMEPENKLPLVRQALEALVGQLRDDDKVSLVTYAGNSGVVLKPTPASAKKKIIQAIRNLGAGGSTNGASGINAAYEQAALNAKKSVASRVILLTDGDFNVGISSQAELKKLIQEKAKSDIFLSVFGVGMGNLKDSTLETLSQNGNGQYGYIDSFREAQRVFVSELSGTLFTVAKDVKLQVEFNPATVGSYRLVGYENRKLNNADFRDDRKDAGDMGAGHMVTALYEIIPESAGDSSDGGLRYQPAVAPSPSVVTGSVSDEILSVSIRYKDEATGKRVEFSRQLLDYGTSSEQADADFRFASAVASFGMVLRDSKFKGQANFDLAIDLAADGVGAAPDAEARNERAEFVDLVRKARNLKSGE